MPFESVRVLYSRKGLDRGRFGDRKANKTAATCGRRGPARTTLLHREGSRPPRIGSFPPPQRLCLQKGRVQAPRQVCSSISVHARSSLALEAAEVSAGGVKRRRINASLSRAAEAACFVLQMSAACRRFLPLAAGSLSSGPVVASSDLHVLSATLFRSGSLHGPSRCPPCVSESSPTMCFICF